MLQALVAGFPGIAQSVSKGESFKVKMSDGRFVLNTLNPDEFLQIGCPDVRRIQRAVGPDVDAARGTVEDPLARFVEVFDSIFDVIRIIGFDPIRCVNGENGGPALRIDPFEGQ